MGAVPGEARRLAGGLVVRHAPEDWEWAHLEVSIVAELYSGTVTVTTPTKELSGPIKEATRSDPAGAAHRMYVAGTGTGTR